MSISQLISVDEPVLGGKREHLSTQVDSGVAAGMSINRSIAQVTRIDYGPCRLAPQLPLVFDAEGAVLPGKLQEEDLEASKPKYSFEAKVRELINLYINRGILIEYQAGLLIDQLLW